ncbi:secreted RxLR effector protein 161-like [Cryptomeria japonica]|uniref:secreted RxLR effector protein 161-like n=1 Tax=Cryptomeria japonica TaxID=3369 RepID=UPI0027DAA9DB|nr:secreted RxLR effector protein 161-like [Cryptomeria japonica]
MAECNAVSTPMVTGCKLSKVDETPDADQTMYRSMIGSLLYLTSSRPDLMQAICMVSRFQSAPKQFHFTVIQRIFKYINGTLDFGLLYPRNDNFTLLAYTDANWAGCVDDKKLTNGAAFFLGDSLVTWDNKKQDCTSLSTTKVEYVATTSCCTQLLWMAQTLLDMGIIVDKPLTIFCDNTSAISLSKNLVMHCRMKHIATRLLFLCEKILTNEVTLQYVPTQAQVADTFTKPLATDAFERLRLRLGVVSQSNLV